MKKSLAIILCIAMFACMLSGCGSTAPTAETGKPAAQAQPAESAGSETKASAEETAKSNVGKSEETAGATTELKNGWEIPKDQLKHFRIAYVGSLDSNELYRMWRASIEAACEGLDIELVCIPDDTELESYYSSIEALLATGIDGVVTQTGISETLLELYTKYKVPVASFCASFSDEMQKQFASYDMYLGNVCEDEYDAAKRLADSMYEAGCRNVGVLAFQRGIAQTMDIRADEFMARFKELGGNILAEDYSFAEFALAIPTFAATYPQMDGMASMVINEAVFQAYTTQDLVGDMKLGGYDLTESAADFFNNGTLVYAAGAQHPTIVMGLAVLLNYLYDGTYIIENREVTVPRSFMAIHSADEYQLFNDCVRYSSCYSPEEVAYMVKALNPDFTAQEFLDINQKFSLEDVLSRTIE